MQSTFSSGVERSLSEKNAKQRCVKGSVAFLYFYAINNQTDIGLAKHCKP